jgi:hypothetical protein
VYLSLRNISFTSTWEEVGIKPDLESTVPFAVVLDMGFDKGTAPSSAQLQVMGTCTPAPIYSIFDGSIP